MGTTKLFVVTVKMLGHLFFCCGGDVSTYVVSAVEFAKMAVCCMILIDLSGMFLFVVVSFHKLVPCDFIQN